MSSEPASATPAYEGIDSRGTDLGRILGLSDGVFAFSMTLLVISLALPAVGTRHGSLVDFLSNDRGPLVAYALGFFVVAAWWSGHHRIFSAIRRYDQVLLQLNNLFLLLVSITPFTLAIVFEYGPTTLWTFDDSAREAIILFAAMQAAVGAVLLGIWRHATDGRRLVDPSLPDAWIRFAEVETGLRVLVFGVSIAVAFVNPLLAEFVWFGVILSRRRTRPPAPPATPVDS
ncbi:MAG: DUF1211 domain-containing protein [Thermoplasmata archaeon]|nr:DUF1211 domain-containing protein [Thermoplasmata archaeon]